MVATGHEAVRIETDGRAAEVTYRTADGKIPARHVLVNASPGTRAPHGRRTAHPRRGRPAEGQHAAQAAAEAARRLVDAREAFSGTFHIAEGYEQIGDRPRSRVPVSCPPHRPPRSTATPSPTRASSARTWSTRAIRPSPSWPPHTRPGLFERDNDAVRAELLKSTLAQLEAHLSEPLADCLATDADGRPCIEAKTPLDLERDLRAARRQHLPPRPRLPVRPEGAGRWGVETRHANVLLCGAGAVRGGGVSGVPGHNAAMAVLEGAND